MKNLVLLLLVISMFSGCSQLAIETSEQYLQNKQMQNHITYVCYDYFDKKDCPRPLLQMDLDVLPVFPGTSRFCFGVATDSLLMPEGMMCYHRDLIRISNG